VSERLRVVVGFPVREGVLARIAAVDDRIAVNHLPQLAGHGLEGSEMRRLLPELQRAEVLFGPATMPRECFEAARQLRWLQVINAGVDALAREGLLDRGFVVTNMGGLVAASIAEYVIGAILMLSKGFHLAIRHQEEHHWGTWRVTELSGQTIGIVGLGAIGRETARRARALGMRVIASRRTVLGGSPDADCDELVSHRSLERLLAESDYVVLCVPLTAETRLLIREPQLARMKRSATLINIARGAIVDQDALVRALRSGTIGAAVLDVTDPEPLPENSPVWDLPNLILTPHISGSVGGYGGRSAELFVSNLERYLRGESLENVVSPRLGY